MITLELIQGSDEWIATRLENYGASEAPSMMGESKYMSRNELLKMKFTGESKPVTPFMQKIFDKGHATEEMARPIVEEIIGEDLYPVTGLLEDSKILASFDGLTMMEDVAYEHKLWNETLAENVKNNILEPHYYWQLEQQLLVAGAEKVIFVTSDGTELNFEYMWYESVPKRRKALIAGWEQFGKDLANYQVEAKKEVIVANEQESFPLIECSVEGSMVISNLGSYIPVIKKLADEQMKLILETDQDFADKEAFNKNVKLGRATLKTQATDIEKQFKSLAEFNGFVSQADKILQKLQSHGEGQVTEAKKIKRLSIINNAESAFNEHLRNLSKTINGVSIALHVNRNDWEGALKGKRSFEKMEEAVNTELANAKIEASEIALVIRKNLDSLTELAKDHKFLFNDHATLLLKDNDDLINLIKARISEHEEEEAERKRLEKEKIEREAKEKAEREAAEELERKAQVIRDEARKKLLAEQEEERLAEAAKVVPEVIVEKKELPVKNVLASKRAKTTTKPVVEKIARQELTPKEKMDQKLKFWKDQYGVRDGEFNDLMNIINQYI